LTIVCILDRLHRDKIREAKSRRSKCARPKEKEEQRLRLFPGGSVLKVACEPGVQGTLM